MICPYCGGKTKVVESRESGSETVRERWCVECFKGFYTTEMLSDTKSTRLKISRAVRRAKDASNRAGQVKAIKGDQKRGEETGQDGLRSGEVRESGRGED